MAIQTEQLISLTDSARDQLRTMIEKKANPGLALRVWVQPGGCSGFKYSLVIEDRAADDDVIVPREGFNVFVDPFSAQYLNGVTIDYVTSMQGSGFTFKNPNSTGGCGCGSSFSA